MVVLILTFKKSGSLVVLDIILFISMTADCMLTLSFVSTLAETCNINNKIQFNYFLKIFNVFMTNMPNT